MEKSDQLPSSRLPAPRLSAELLPLALILGCVAGSLLLILAAYRRYAAKPEKPAIAVATASHPNPAPVVAPPAPTPKPQPKPKPVPVEDPTPKELARLAAEAADLNAAAEAADRKAAALGEALRAAAADVQRWKRREVLVRAQAAKLDAEAQRLETEAETLALERDVLARQRDEAHASLKQAYARAGASFAVLPYKGPNGTWHRPIVLECRDGTVTLQPKGPSFDLYELSILSSMRGSPFLATVAQAALRAQDGPSPDGAPVVPYILFVIRPDGIRPYYEARARLEPLGITFGYELVDQDWEIDYPDLDDPVEWDDRVPVKLPAPRRPPDPADADRLAAGAGAGRDGDVPSSPSARDGGSPAAFVWPVTPPGATGVRPTGMEPGSGLSGGGSWSSARPGGSGSAGGPSSTDGQWRAGGGAPGPGGGGASQAHGRSRPQPGATAEASAPSGAGAAGGPPAEGGSSPLGGGLPSGLDGDPAGPGTPTANAGPRPPARGTGGSGSRWTTAGTGSIDNQIDTHSLSNSIDSAAPAPSGPAGDLLSGHGPLPPSGRDGSGTGSGGPGPNVSNGQGPNASKSLKLSGPPGTASQPPWDRDSSQEGLDPPVPNDGRVEIRPDDIEESLNEKELAELRALQAQNRPGAPSGPLAGGGFPAPPDAPTVLGNRASGSSDTSSVDRSSSRGPANPAPALPGTTPPGVIASPGQPAEKGSSDASNSRLQFEGPPEHDLELVVTCGPKGITIHPGGYRMSIPNLKIGDDYFIRELKAIVRRRQRSEPNVVWHPRLRFLIEPGGEETYKLVRRQTIFSGTGWPVSFQVVDADPIHLYRQEGW
jgi:hypothetical protein